MLNYDNADKRRMVEHCIRTGKALVNPIIDWEEEDVWEFLNSNGIEHCCLYDQGYKRLGCIGCPMNTAAAAADLEKYPAYKQLYLKAFDRMIQKRKEKGLGVLGKWETPEKVMKWWLKQEDDDGPAADVNR